MPPIKKAKKRSAPKKKIKVLPNLDFIKSKAKEIVSYSMSHARPDKKSKDFPHWYAGITNNPKVRIIGHKRKAKRDDLPTFHPYYAHTYANARGIEKYLCDNHGFSHCKMPGKANRDDHKSPSNYVYVYLLPVHLR